MNETSSPDAQGTSSSLQRMLQLAPTLAIAVSVTFFSLGLLIVNLRLAQYGVSSHDFVRTEYVLVGAAFVTLVVGAGVGAAYGVGGIRYSIYLWKHEKKLRAIWYTTLALAGAVGLPIGVIRLLSAGRLDYGNWRTWATIALLAFSARTALDTFKHMHTAWRLAYIPLATASKESIVDRLSSTLISAPAFIASVALYAYFIYPLLLPAYGGGYRDGVVLYPTSRGREVLVTIGLPMQADGTGGPVQPLTESEAELVIVRGEGDWSTAHGVRLNRNLFDAVIISKPKTK